MRKSDKKGDCHDRIEIGINIDLGLSIFHPICHAEVSKAEMSEGKKLERQMWAAFKEKNWVEVESKIARGFQSVHQDGARDREAEVKLIKGLNLGEYTLNNFKVTEHGPALIITYSASVQEMIAGENMDKRSERLSVWIKTDNGWQWIAHANLVPLKN